MVKHNKIAILATVICTLFLISVGINIYQHIKVIQFKKNITDLTQHYMSMHEGVFYNALYVKGSYDMQNIKDIETLNHIIEEVQKADIYYEDAKYTENYWGNKQGGVDSGIQTKFLINGYIAELKSLRAKLVANKSITNEDINNATAVIDDLKISAEWLVKRYKNNDFTLYGDKDFYDNVYGKLTSNIKTIFHY